ncbi:MAG: hypothetical protein CSA95_01585 [Bacteroidetes bacterium]|nr:MAG: hypothetical protein CSA95_01585 [Bacteroidota bacterium]
MQHKNAQKEKENPKVKLTFGRENYRIMLIGILLIGLGFLLMIGGGSDDPQVFNKAMFSTMRITIAPILILAGFVTEIVAIMWRSKK